MPIPISGIDTSQQLPSFDLVSEFEPLQSSLDPSELDPVYSPSDRPGSAGSKAWPALSSGEHYGVIGQPFKDHAPAQSASEKRESVDSSTAETSVRLQPQGESVATPLPSGSRRALRETFRTPSPQLAAPSQEESRPARKYEYIPEMIADIETQVPSFHMETPGIGKAAFPQSSLVLYLLPQRRLSRHGPSLLV